MYLVLPILLIAVRDRYQGLASSLLEFLIFKASYRDTVNCTLMYTDLVLCLKITVAPHSLLFRTTLTLGIRIILPPWPSVSLPTTPPLPFIHLMWPKSKPNTQARVLILVQLRFGSS
jgi:hypothetical protein